MKNLENIPKKEIFTVPDGYFESLPGKIQARISAQDSSAKPGFFFRFKMQYALPAMLLVMLGLYSYFASTDKANAESILATVNTEALVAYLNDNDIPAEEFLENLELNDDDVEALEDEVYDLNFGSDALEDEFGPIDLDNI
jgi:hypothetical protein